MFELEHQRVDLHQVKVRMGLESWAHRYVSMEELRFEKEEQVVPVIIVQNLPLMDLKCFLEMVVQKLAWW